MSEPVFSASWYRVAQLRPRLRSHAEIVRHHYRGQLWYVLQDRLSGRQHRFTPAAHYVIALMDGKRSFHRIWEIANEHLGDDAPTQDEMIQLFGQLHASDLLLCDVSPDSVELFQRYQKQARNALKQRWLNPLSLRLSLWDPDRFLERWKFLGTWLFSWVGAALWLIVFTAAVLAAASHWADLTQNAADRVLAPHNLLLLLIVYPLIKLLHELGHAFATKRWGGEVHELGIMLLVFMPVPFVDASGASAFRDKKRRMIVGAAGMLVELFLAALAMFVWLVVEPGWVRAIAFNVMLIGSISTILFNINPLLKFDGYFIFADLVELPNLAAHSNQHLGYLVQRYLFGIDQAQSAAATSGERVWFTLYGIAAFCYRLFVSFVIIAFVAGQFFVIGVLLALWALVSMVALPLAKGLRFLFVSDVIARRRARAVGATFAVIGAFAVVLGLLPAPLTTTTEGVVWLPENSHVRAATGGFVRRMLLAPNAYVRAGDALFETEEPLLIARRRALEFRLQELQARYTALWVSNKVEAQIIQKAIVPVRAQLERARESEENLIIRSPANGQLIVPHAEDLPDQWLKQGQVVAYITQENVLSVRAVVAQDRIGLIRQRTQRVAVKPVGAPQQSFAASIQREVPAASDELPSAALSKAGGGRIATHPDDATHRRAFEPLFQIDLRVTGTQRFGDIGSRVFVRFEHGSEPLLQQWLRKARLLFLRRYGV